MGIILLLMIIGYIFCLKRHETKEEPKYKYFDNQTIQCSYCEKYIYMGYTSFRDDKICSCHKRDVDIGKFVKTEEDLKNITDILRNFKLKHQ